MAFTGKATYSAGITLPEIAEDVSDLIGIISPTETFLLDAIGDPLREAKSTYHEWLEDSLVPNKDTISDSSISDPDGETSFDVAHGDRFRTGDQIQIAGSEELILVTGVSDNTITVVRGYAGTTPENIANGQVIHILGNAAIEGDDKPAARFTNRVRCGNYTQIFTAGVEVSGTNIAASHIGIADEMDHQKGERLRELIRDLENTVINGGQPSANPQGSASVRRSMKGIIQNVATHIYRPSDRIDISKTNVAEVTSKKNYLPVTHRYIVQGDYKIYEATFELIKAWDPALEANDYDRYSPLTNENFNEVRDVWRKWCLNEAGDYSASPYNQGAAFDFSRIFENGSYIRSRRRFLSVLTCSKDGSSIGYYLEVSYTGGACWWPYMGSFKVLLDQCGVWLSAEQLDTDMWFAILKGILKFRITASVCADERISFTVADGPVDSTIEVVDKVITLPRRFKYQKVSPESIFVNDSANQTDDTASLVEYARGISDSGGFDTEQLQIKTMVLSPAFSPGDKIRTSPDSRDILGVKYDNRSVCRLEKIEMDFVHQQTILTAVKKRR